MDASRHLRTPLRQTASFGTPLPPQLAVPKPLYSQVRDMIASQISGGELAPGSTLPNEVALAERYGVSVGTIRRAVEGLEEMGVVMRRQGRGTFVSTPGTSTATTRLQRLVGPNGETLPLTRALVSLRQRPAEPGESSLLDAGAEGQVVEVVCVVLIARRKVGSERSVLPGHLAKPIQEGLSANRDLYAAIAAAGSIVTRIEDRITADITVEEDMRDFGARAGAGVLQLARRAISISGETVEMRMGRYLSSAIGYAAKSP